MFKGDVLHTQFACLFEDRLDRLTCLPAASFLFVGFETKHAPVCTLPGQTPAETLKDMPRVCVKL